MKTPRLSSVEWLARVRAANAGPELLDWITRRITTPYEEGPMLDDRNGESSEEVFERLAQEDETFRTRLEETAREYFAGDASNPEQQSAIPVIRAMLDLVQRRALSGANPAIRGWLARHDAVLRAEAGGYVGRAALGALAISQLPGVADMRDFWLQLWREGPPSWQPRAFIGLRLQDPEAAVREIPDLVQRTETLGQDPAALLHGLWNQSTGRDALLRWLDTHKGDPAAISVRVALLKRVKDHERTLLDRMMPNSLRRTPPQPLGSLAPAQAHNWY